MLSDMSHRYVSVAQLALSSGIRRQDVRQFVDMLGARGLIIERDASLPDSLFGSLRPLGGWFKLALASSHTER